MSTHESGDGTSSMIVAASSRPKLRILKIAIPFILVCFGGIYAWTAGLLPFTATAPHSEIPTPKLNLAADTDRSHPRYKASYLEIQSPFTANLNNSSRLVQVEIGVSTYYDPVVLSRVQAHEIPIRSAVLAILAQQSEATITSPAGRALLERKLALAVNQVLAEREGFGGVDHVYLTGLVIQ